MENQQALLQDRKWKFQLIMPLVIVSFMTLFFWALGGGKIESTTAATNEKSGFNNKLPDANLKDEKGLDKMSYYDQAGRDSAKLREQNKNGSVGIDSTLAGNQLLQHPVQATMNISPYYGQQYNASGDAAVYQKLQQLNQSLNQSQAPLYQPEQNDMQNISDHQALERLEKMMQQMQTGNSSNDPETEQLDGMLDKVLDIQYPERAQEKLRKSSAQHIGQVFAVAAAGKRNYISSLEQKRSGGDPAGEENGFYSLADPVDADTDQNAIDAVIHETQTIVNGSTVKLRLLNDVFINGKLIPKDNFVFGTASLNGERLSIQITGIRYKKSLFPVTLSVIDIDGMDGIYIPGAISREVAKESTDRAIQDVSFGSMSSSLGVQAAGAGIEAAKSLFSKKVKLIKVTVKAGYKVLLRDEKQKLNNQ